MKRAHWLPALVVGILAALVAQPEMVLAQGCVTAECHVGMDSREWVHGPVGAGICNICHVTENEKKHEFKLVAEGSELCFGCHDTNRDMMLDESIHTAVADGDCIGCHDPHGSSYQFSLRESGSTLCFGCHDQDEFMDNFVHPPVQEGECLACHDPHSSPFEANLLNAADDLCVECHTDASSYREQRHPHAPVEERCINCHAPHAEQARYLLPEDPPDLCIGCHADFAEYANVETPHSPVASGACRECHNVHGSANPKLFPVEPTVLCFQCHGELDAYVAEQAFRHGPVQQGDCNACHDPHGSNNARVLRKYFPAEFYTPYAEEKYELCFECHNREIAVHELTNSLTDFRDGERNLHFLHVNKQEKGRSCRACHQVHASSQSKHVRTSVPYGTMDWELPVEFTKTEKGGSCVVGCHAPKQYTR